MSEFLDEIEACVPALRRFARALTHDPDGADDLVQDCLERALRKRALWRPTGALRSWLFRILVNLHRNERRARGRRGMPVGLDGLPPGVEPSEAASAPGRLALAETARAMEVLPEDQRAALLLVVLEGMSYAQAAETLEIPIGTLMSRLGRARAALRRAIDGEQPRLRSVK